MERVVSAYSPSWHWLFAVAWRRQQNQVRPADDHVEDLDHVRSVQTNIFTISLGMDMSSFAYAHVAKHVFDVRACSLRSHAP